MVSYVGMDSWVYILFGALWIAFAVYKGSKKAVSQTEEAGEKTSTSTSSTSSELNKIVDSFLAEEGIAEDISKNKEEKTAEESVAEPEKAVVLEEGVRTTHTGWEPEETAPRLKTRKINLKKAIIYSEILRRPYE
jgi:hypothetical protein